jgi:hypothetical protein
MTASPTDILTLENFDDEEIFDIVHLLEKSFELEFDKNAFWDVKTFGDMIDVFENHIKGENRDDCSSQQAFYKVRLAIENACLISPGSIVPGTRLRDIFPKGERRKKAKAFKLNLGADFGLMDWPGWLQTILVLGIILSFIIIFFSWQVGLSGFLFFAVAIKAGDWFGRDLKFKTVGELTKKLVRENYKASRRNPDSFNKKEIAVVITDTFSEYLEIEKNYLGREARFSWAMEPKAERLPD